jgi:hypothetical protein
MLVQGLKWALDWNWRRALVAPRVWNFQENLTSYLRGQENIKWPASYVIAMAPVSSPGRRCENLEGALYTWTVRGG